MVQSGGATLSTPAQLSLGDENALRRAYSERMRRLGQKLRPQGGPASSSALGETTMRRGRAVGRSGTGHGAYLDKAGNLDGSGLDRESAELQVEALVQQLRRLCHERRVLREETEAVGQRQRCAIKNFKVDLELAQREHAGMKAEQARLRKMLSEGDEVWQMERERLATFEDDSVRCLQLEAEKIGAACQMTAEHLASLQGEARDYQQRIDQVTQEQKAVHEDSVAVAGAKDAAEAELRDLHSRVHRSEAEIGELKQKYSLVGERFEQVMDMSQKENHAAERALKAKVRRVRRQTEKQRRRTEEANERLAKARAGKAQWEAVLRERDAEIQRLRAAIRSERENALKSEELFFESQRRLVQEQASDAKKRGGMIPISVHRRILEEQAGFFQATTRQLEDVRQQQQRSQEQERLRIQERERDIDSEAALEAAARQAAMSRKISFLEEELREVRTGVGEAEASAKVAEEQRSTLAAPLEAASARLGMLRDTLETERRAKDRAEQSLAESRAKLASVRAAAKGSEAQLDSRAAWRGHYRLLEASCCERQRRISALSASLAELGDKECECASELAALRGQSREIELTLHAVHQRILHLDEQRIVDARAIRHKQEAALRLRSLLDGHADLTRRAMAQLRTRLRDEQRAFAVELQGWAQKWHGALSHERKRERTIGISHKRDAETANCAGEALAGRLNDIQAEIARRRLQVECALERASSQRTMAEDAHSAARLAAAGTERIVLCIQAALPDGLSEGVVQGLLGRSACCGERGDSGSSHAGGTAVAASPAFAAAGIPKESALASLDVELRRTVEASETAAATGEEHRCVALLMQDRADREAEEAARHAEVTRRCADAAVQIREQEAELCRLNLDSTADPATSHNGGGEGLREREGRVAALRAGTTRAEERALVADLRLQDLRMELGTRVEALSASAEEARRAACRPLQRELREVGAELETLRERFPCELRRRAMQWEEHVLQREHQHREEQDMAEAKLRAEMQQLRQDLLELGSAQATAFETQDSSVVQLDGDLASVQTDINELHSELRALEDKREASVRGAQLHREALRRAERRLAETCEGYRRVTTEAAEAGHVSVRQHEDAVRRLRRQRDEEVQRLEAAVRRSLGDLSTELFADGDQVLHVYSELETSAELLAGRARAHLSSVGA